MKQPRSGHNAVKFLIFKSPFAATTGSRVAVKIFPGQTALTSLVVVTLLTLTGCTTVTRAKDAVVDNTRNAVQVIKRKVAVVAAPAKQAENAPSAPDINQADSAKPRPASPSLSSNFADGLELTGMLSVVRPKGCLASKGCKPSYRLYNENFSIRTALAGDVHEVHDGMLVTLKGRWVPLTGPTLTGDSWRRTDSALAVASYDVVTGHRYRDFLVARADDFSNQTYGCASAWDRSFGWQIVNREPYLIVRLTNPLNRTTPQFVELWYHGKSGKFLRESKSDAKIDPCR